MCYFKPIGCPISKINRRTQIFVSAALCMCICLFFYMQFVHERCIYSVRYISCVCAYLLTVVIVIVLRCTFAYCDCVFFFYFRGRWGKGGREKAVSLCSVMKRPSLTRNWVCLFVFFLGKRTHASIHSAFVDICYSCNFHIPRPIVPITLNLTWLVCCSKSACLALLQFLACY